MGKAMPHQLIPPASRFQRERLACLQADSRPIPGVVAPHLRLTVLTENIEFLKKQAAVTKVTAYHATLIFLL